VFDWNRNGFDVYCNCLARVLCTGTLRLFAVQYVGVYSAITAWNSPQAVRTEVLLYCILEVTVPASTAAVRAVVGGEDSRHGIAAAGRPAATSFAAAESVE
jgi:hypothetical protein